MNIYLFYFHALIASALIFTVRTATIIYILNVQGFQCF